MKFLCGSCRTKYQISDEKVRGKVLTIRCKKCGAKVLVRESFGQKPGTIVAPPVEEKKAEVAERAASGAPRAAVAATLASAFEVAMRAETDEIPTSIGPGPALDDGGGDPDGIEWYVAMDGNQVGPFTEAEVVRRLRARELEGRHYVWRDGFDAWKRIREAPDFAQHVREDKRRSLPPPLPAEGPGAKVVDFSAKRAERERKAGAPSAPIRVSPAVSPSADLPSEIPTAAQVMGPVLEPNASPDAPLVAADAQAAAVVVPATVPAPAAQAGLPGAPLQPVTPPVPGVALEVSPMDGAVALKAKVGLEPEAAAEAFLSRDPAAEPMPENLFDGVPRASEADLVPRESTRFFVAAAGMEARKSRHKVALVAGIAIAASFVGFMGAWASGAVHVALPIIGNPFQRGDAPAAATETRESSEASATERKRLAALGADPRTGAPGVIGRAPRPHAAIRAGGKGAEPSGDFVADAQKPGEEGRRGDSVERVGIGAFGPDGTLGGNVDLEARLPEADPQRELPETGSLSEQDIHDVIASRSSSVKICYENALRGRSDFGGKLEFAVTIQPSGEVSRAQVATAQFRGTSLAGCIADKIKQWRFPRFHGAEKQIDVPFVLAKGSY